MTATSVRCKRFCYEVAELANKEVVEREEELEAYKLTKKYRGVSRRSTVVLVVSPFCYVGSTYS